MSLFYLIMAAIALLGALLFVFLSTPKQYVILEQEECSKDESIKQTFLFLCDKRALKVFPFMVYRGVLYSAQTSVFINLWTSMLLDESSEEAMRIALNTFLTFGIGQVIGPLVLGHVQDKYGYKATMILIFMENLVFLIITIIVNEIHSFTSVAHICMFGYGALDSSVLCLCDILCGFEFESKYIPFSAQNLIKNMAIFLTVGILSIYELESI